MENELSFVEGQIDALMELRKEFERQYKYKGRYYSITTSDIIFEIDVLLDTAKLEREKINGHN